MKATRIAMRARPMIVSMTSPTIFPADKSELAPVTADALAGWRKHNGFMGGQGRGRNQIWIRKGGKMVVLGKVAVGYIIGLSSG